MSTSFYYPIKITIRLFHVRTIKWHWRWFLMKIKDLINKAVNKEHITDDEKNKIFFYLRHIPNAMKTDAEFNLYCKMAEEVGLPKPDRNSIVRPLNEGKRIEFN